MASNIPEWSEFKKLVQLKAEPLFEQAEQIKREIVAREQQLEDVKLMLGAKMASADAKSVLHNGAKFIWQDAAEARSLDKDWAKKTLLAKGVSMKEIEKHEKVTERKAHLKISLPDE